MGTPIQSPKKNGKRTLVRFERRHEPLLSRAAFLARMLRHAWVVVLLIGCALGIGAAGYHYLERLPWIDAVLNAAMILGGMGPVNALQTDAGKLFAAGYALFSGLFFVATAGVLFAPLIHRAFHRFHIEQEEDPR